MAHEELHLNLRNLTLDDYGQLQELICVRELAGDGELDALSGTLFQPPAGRDMRLVAEPSVRQGMLESANVDHASEIVSLMAAQRQMELGSQIFRTYDRMMEQAMTTFGRTR